MERTHDHHGAQPSNLRLATSATLHCLLGCGLGEVAGMIISRALGWDPVPSIILAVCMGIVGGFLLGIIPWLKHGFSMIEATKKVAVIEGLSIAAMETAEVLTEVYVPGVMQAGLAEPIFWYGMLLALAAGFAAAFPVNFIFAKRGIRHMH
jgi:putative flippase GtrA